MTQWDEVVNDLKLLHSAFGSCARKAHARPLSTPSSYSQPESLKLPDALSRA